MLKSLGTGRKQTQRTLTGLVESGEKGKKGNQRKMSFREKIGRERTRSLKFGLKGS